MRVVFIYGPPGSGKTTNAHFLKGKYGCKRIIEEHSLSPFQEDDLVLLQQKPAVVPDGAIVMHIAEALRS